MTSAELVRIAEARGLRLEPQGDRLIVEGPRGALHDLRADLVRHKPDVLALLRERRADCASDAVAAAARLLRVGRWAPEDSPCRFHIGETGSICRRCGANWAQHHGSAAGMGASESHDVREHPTTGDSGTSPEARR